MNLPIDPKFREMLLSHCAPPSQNNERAYWNRKIDLWNKTKLEIVGEDIADRFNLNYDYKSGRDYGNEYEPRLTEQD